MLKGGIIGLGKMGISHAAIVGAHPSVDFVAVCDTSSLVLEAFNKYTDVHTYSDYKKMVENEKLDFVVIATPTKYHYPMVKYALEKNIHVFCEKPFSLTTKEGEELVKMAMQRSLINQVGYHNHFIGTFRELSRLLKANVIGDLVHFTGEAYGPVVTKEKGGTWRSKPEEGGGCMFDFASHVINLIQEVVGRPIKINGVLLKSVYSKGVEDAVYSLLTLENKISGVLLVNWSDETYRKMSTSLSIEGKKGKIICDATEIKIYLKEANQNEGLEKGWTIKYITDFALPVNYHLRGEEYSAQIDYFVDNIINKKQGTLNTFEQGVCTDKVIEMILKKQNKLKMEKVLFGDNQFFAVNHVSDEKSRAQAIRFKDDSSIIKVLDQAIDLGINTFMCTTHDRIASICDHILGNPEQYKDFKLYPCMPYAHKYANAVTELGIVGTIKQYVPGNIFGTFAKGGMAYLNKDFGKLMEIFIDAEMKMFQGINTPVIFIQNVLVDMILGLKMNDIFVEFDAYIRKKYNAEPGYITMNMPALLDRLNAVGIKNPVICSSINKIGFRMAGGNAIYEKYLQEKEFRPIAMQVLAAGALRPKEAIEYLGKFPKIESVLFGASSKQHIEETKELIEKYL